MSWAPLIIGIGRLAYQAAKGSKEAELVKDAETSQESNRIDILELVGKVQKGWTIKNQNILTQDEFQKLKHGLLNGIELKGVMQSPMECLRAMMPLVELGAVSVEEMKHMKQVLEG